MGEITVATAWVRKARWKTSDLSLQLNRLEKEQQVKPKETETVKSRSMRRNETDAERRTSSSASSSSSFTATKVNESDGTALIRVPADPPQDRSAEPKLQVAGTAHREDST